MTVLLARAVMTLATCMLDEDRQAWVAAMRAEFEGTVPPRERLSFALGCLMAAGRDMIAREAGCFTLTSYALALALMLPMAALQIGCAIFDLPYLYRAPGGLADALLAGREHEGLIRSVYQAAVPSLALLLLLLGLGHLRLAWAMLERDWARVTRIGAVTLAGTVTLVTLMAVLFLDARQALLQGLVLAIELVTVAMVVRWHARLPAVCRSEPPG